MPQCAAWRSTNKAAGLLHGHFFDAAVAFLGIQGQHAVCVLRLGLRIVDFLGEAEGTRDVAPVALAAQYLVAVGARGLFAL